LEGHLEGKRDALVKELKGNEVECRPIVAGNFMRNPVIDYVTYIDHKDYTNANYIHENGLFIGNDVVNLEQNIDLVYQIIKGLK